MKKQLIKYLSISLAIIGCISFSPKMAKAALNENSIISFEDSFMTHKDKDKDKDKSNNDIFSEENQKYLSSSQKKQLKEIKKCKDNGKKLTEEQEKNLHSIMDSIIKGKLGDEKYKDFKKLIDKKKSGTQLTEDEVKKLQEYTKIINEAKHSRANEILNQFLR